ncbi:MAG TPA: ABC transporter ATP-binding protein, partial [Rectinemataceae bacterium]|nr:ABC transporter ATP-binding protein [Rectinemataceae bacterium]
MQSIILDVKGLEIAYKTQDGVVCALNTVDLVLHEGETLGLVGETGAGKTTLAKGIMRLIPTPPGVIKKGEILYHGKNLLQVSADEMREIRGREISMIFQDPMTSLNPVMTVGEQIAEAVLSHGELPKQEVIQKTKQMLELVGIPAERSDEYPHQFSGGMKQRVIIAIALTCNPKVLIADEPTTALDVTIQAQVLELMRKLRQQLNTSMLLITHDLGVVAQNCEYVAVIYAGEIVEYGTVMEIFKDMRHPYTIGLFTSLPNLNKVVRRLIPIEGLMPDPMYLPSGCK